MRGVTRTGIDRGDRLIEVGARMPERHALSCAYEPRNQVERTVDLGRHGHDADVRGFRVDDVENVAPAKRSVPPFVIRQAKTRDRLRAVEVGVDEVALE